jgi:hypothetical protein
MPVKYKLYIHHYYSKTLFYKILHNTTHRVYRLNNSVGSIFCKYNDLDIEVIFDPILNDNTDGYHILDFMTILYQFKKDVKFSEIKCINDKQHTTAHRGAMGAEFGVNDVPIMKWIADTLLNKKNWIIFILRTEKSYIKYDGINYLGVLDLETQIERLKNHYLIDDNIFIDDTIQLNYPNSNFALTNTIHQWNELLSIRWYYEFKNVFEKLNPPYDLCFSIRYHKRHRKDYILKLSEFNHPKIYLSRVDNCINTEFKRYGDSLKNIDNVNFNITNGDNFDDLTIVENIEHYLDYLMRILPMAKMHILSETWDWTSNMSSGYLSEKTYGLILAGVPFISLHPYPLEMIHKILNIREHPFYKNSLQYKNKPELFIEFIKTFMDNFENNYKLCKEWTDDCNEKLMYLVNNTNSFLDLLQDDSLKISNFSTTEKFKKLI